MKLIQTDGIKAYRETFKLERFIDYLDEHYLTQLTKTAGQQYCSETGFVVGFLSPDEMRDAVNGAVAALGLSHLEDIMVEHSKQAVEQAIQDIATHLTDRMIVTSRPGFGLVAANGHYEGLTPLRQVMLMLNRLIFMRRKQRRDFGYEARLATQKVLINLAEYMRSVSMTHREEFRTLLLEIDSKYGLDEIHFNNNEKVILSQFEQEFDIELLMDILNSVLLRYDTNRTLNPKMRWSQRAWAESIMNDPRMPERSNILSENMKAYIADQTRVANAKRAKRRGKGKPRKPVDNSMAARRARDAKAEAKVARVAQRNLLRTKLKARLGTSAMLGGK